MWFLEIVNKHPIDIAILDIKMPRLNGIEALKEIKKIKNEFTGVVEGVKGESNKDNQKEVSK